MLHLNFVLWCLIVHWHLFKCLIFCCKILCGGEFSKLRRATSEISLFIWLLSLCFIYKLRAAFYWVSFPLTLTSVDFVNVPSSHNLESFHKMVVENGGAISMNLNAAVTHCIAAERKGYFLHEC